MAPVDTSRRSSSTSISRSSIPVRPSRAKATSGSRATTEWSWIAADSMRRSGPRRPSSTISRSTSTTPRSSCATRGRILEEMGARGPRLDECARHIYDEWAACQHFFLYDDVAPALRELAGVGFKLGLISNSHRPLDAFQEHFELQGLIAGAVSSSDHGFMKPHPSIFESALELLGVERAQVGDGRRQLHARHRRRAERRHAWRAGAPVGRPRAGARRARRAQPAGAAAGADWNRPAEPVRRLRRRVRTSPNARSSRTIIPAASGMRGRRAGAGGCGTPSGPRRRCS